MLAAFLLQEMDFSVNCPNLHVEGFGAKCISEIVETSLNFFAGLCRPSFLITLQFVGGMRGGNHVYRILINVLQVTPTVRWVCCHLAAVSAIAY
jgi:hypothetical protein